MFRAVTHEIHLVVYWIRQEDIQLYNSNSSNTQRKSEMDHSCKIVEWLKIKKSGSHEWDFKFYE